LRLPAVLPRCAGAAAPKRKAWRRFQPSVVAFYRQAFDETLRDPEFLDDAHKLGLDVNSISGPAVEQRIDELYRAPEDWLRSTQPHSEPVTRELLRAGPI
jgi:hypothetical protein